MCIIENALLHQRECFLTEPEWSSVTVSLEGRTELYTVYYKILRQMLLWPNLVRKKLDLYKVDTGVKSSASLHLLTMVHEIKARLGEIGVELDALAKGHDLVRHIPSTCLTDLVDEMFQIQSPMAALAFCYHAMYSIIVSRILLSLVHNDPFYQFELEIEISGLSRGIWVLVEYGRCYQPLGLPILSISLALTLESVSRKAQQEITMLVNELESARESSAGSWTTEQLVHQAMVYRGECSAYH